MFKFGVLELSTLPGALLAWIVSLIICSNVLNAQQYAPKEDSSDDEFDVAVQVESFDVIWNTIKKSHWNEEMVGADWDAARDELRPKIESASSVGDARKVMNELLQRLGQSHFGIIPNESYELLEERKKTGGEGFSGLTIRLIENEIVVTAVRENSPAASADIRVGSVISRIGEKTAEEIIETAKKTSDHSPARLDTSVALLCDGLTSGGIGDEVELEFDSAEENTTTLTLVKGPGKRARLGHLPAFTLEHRTKSLTGNVGYLAFNVFFDPVDMMKEFRATLDNHRNSEGLIIDLRGNRGGMVMMVCGMCSWFVEKTDETPDVGEMRPKGNPLKLVLNPRIPRYEKPVAVLIDECSISAAEIMAGGMQDLGIARVFGNQTAGLVLPSIVTKLPNGDGFQYALSDYVTTKGKTLEGVGVAPDVEIKLSKEILRAEGDPVLEAARAWIVEQNKDK